jgi:hypothetical protein
LLRTYLQLIISINQKLKDMFKIMNNKGFHMTFDNGFTISVQFGKENYCGSRHIEDNDTKLLWQSPDAEIAVLYNGSLLSIGEYDQVIGWVSAGSVAKAIHIVSTATNVDDILEGIAVQGVKQES